MSIKSAWTQSKKFSNVPPIDFNCLHWDCLSPYGETRHSFASWLFHRLGSATHTNVTLKSSLSDSTLWTTETAALHCMQLPHFLCRLLLWCLWKPSVSACTLLRECECVWSTFVNSLSHTQVHECTCSKQLSCCLHRDSCNCSFWPSSYFICTRFQPVALDDY